MKKTNKRQRLESEINSKTDSINDIDYYGYDTTLKRIEQRIELRNELNKIKNKHKNIIDEINNEMNKRIITMEMIYELKLQMDDYIWFQNYINIRNELEDNTEEKYNITNTIYTKYMILKDIDFSNIENISNDINNEKSIIKKIFSSDNDNYVKSILYKKYKLFCENKESCSEGYAKCLEWINTVLSIPSKPLISHNFDKKNINDINNKLKNVHHSLSNNIYGLNQIKEKIMEILCAKLLNPNDPNGKILCLVGPPGVGKTIIASTIANALDLPFNHISFGSIQDSKLLTGHSSTYIGSVPSLFTNILIKAKRLDSLVLLDEIDKITNGYDSNITSVLIHALDKSQNNKFMDAYIPEIPLNLSYILFICTANDANIIDPILKDRMTIINLFGYSIEDKINICEKYLLPKYIKELSFDKNEIIISSKELKYLITKISSEQPGMRDIERKLKELLDKLALLKYSKDIIYSFDIKNIKFPITITNDIINKLFNIN